MASCHWFRQDNVDHVLDQDLKELIYQGNNKKAIEIYMGITEEFANLKNHRACMS